jgi:hypothetical protein
MRNTATVTFILKQLFPWRCQDGRAGFDYPLKAPDGGAD